MRLNPSALKALRERSGMSIKGLAEAASEHMPGDKAVDPNHLSNIEAGRRNPSEQVGVALAKALKVPQTAILADPAEVPS